MTVSVQKRVVLLALLVSCGFVVFFLWRRQGGEPAPRETLGAPNEALARRLAGSRGDDGGASAGHTLDSVPIALVWIPPGRFLMGSPSGDEGTGPREFARSADEGPQREVTITRGFWMGQYEVTQAEWEAVTGDNPSHFPGARRPVESVSWHECMTFCERLSEREGRTVRLPTEAEWEYAARAGVLDYRYGDLSDVGAIAWTTYNANKTQEVGQKQPNPWGLFDVYGNVEEWCEDWKGDYAKLGAIDPTGPGTGRLKVVRGGYYRSGNGGIRAAARSGASPDRASPSRGFRIVVEAPVRSSLE